MPDPLTQSARAALAARAAEQSAGPGRLLDDPLSVRWLNTLGPPNTTVGRATQVAVCVRARQFDRWLADWAEQQSDGVAVELGVGFSTRLHRLRQLPLAWLGVDRPEVTTLRHPPPTSRSPRFPNVGLLPDILPTLLSLDLPSPALPARLRDHLHGRPPCFLAEGLCMYLPRRDLDALLARLAAAFPGAPLLLDAYAPPARALARFHDTLPGLNLSIRSTLTASPHLHLNQTHTLRDHPDARPRLPWPYRLPGIAHLHRLHHTTLRHP
jgi:O-methyltransferase involved in polyketide biosynthesis